MKNEIHSVILSGGVGSRLWPASREQDPKQFIKLNDGLSFIQKAFERCLNLPNISSILNVTNRDFLFRIKDEYQDMVESVKAKSNKKIDSNYILEPFGRNPAPAIIAAALNIKALYGEDSIMLVLPSDHIIENQEKFNEAVFEAANLANLDKIALFGIHPDTPETGYGYIQAKGNEVIRFVEKPNLDKAKQYLASGDYLWNSGLFCFKAKTILNEAKKYCPDILADVTKCIKLSEVSKGNAYSVLELDSETFAKVTNDSIDYSIMEKSDNTAVVSCDIGWSDVGNWNAISKLHQEADSNGNVINGNIILQDVTNSYIESKDRVIGALGLDNLLIIDTKDALLVASKDKSQNVKDIYTKVKELGCDTYKNHLKVHRPWGTYTVLEEGIGFKIKRIEVMQGEKLSLQMHDHRSEHWVVVSGEANVVNGDKDLVLKEGNSTFIPAKNKHRLANLTKEKLVIIEVQVGSYLGEDDIHRFDDVYGRVSNG